MIGRIAGVLLEKNPPHLLVDCNGVGYEVDVPMSTFYNLPSTGEKVVLLTQLIVREDAHLLYGFGTTQERSTFRELLKISGIGARMALAVLLLPAAGRAADAVPVVATFSVIGDMLANIGGDHIALRTIVGAGGDCELYQPTAADVATVASARAIEEPLRWIATNAGQEGSIVLAKVRDMGHDEGFNALNDKYENLVRAGVIDPTKVVRSALQNAASIASLLLTTEAVVSEIPEKSKAPEGHGGGGMY